MEKADLKRLVLHRRGRNPGSKAGSETVARAATRELDDIAARRAKLTDWLDSVFSRRTETAALSEDKARVSAEARAELKRLAAKERQYKRELAALERREADIREALSGTDENRSAARSVNRRRLRAAIGGAVGVAAVVLGLLYFGEIRQGVLRTLMSEERKAAVEKRAAADFTAGALDEAEAKLRRVVAAYPEDLEAGIDLVGLYMVSGELGKAQSLVGKLQEEHPGDERIATWVRLLGRPQE